MVTRIMLMYTPSEALLADCQFQVFIQNTHELNILVRLHLHLARFPQPQRALRLQCSKMRAS
jgi:hypothetical protein